MGHGRSYTSLVEWLLPSFREVSRKRNKPTQQDLATGSRVTRRLSFPMAPIPVHVGLVGTRGDLGGFFKRWTEARRERPCFRFLHGGLREVRPGFDRAILQPLDEARSCRDEVGLVLPRRPALGAPHVSELRVLAGSCAVRLPVLGAGDGRQGPGAAGHVPLRPRLVGAGASART